MIKTNRLSLLSLSFACVEAKPNWNSFGVVQHMEEYDILHKTPDSKFGKW